MATASRVSRRILIPAFAGAAATFSAAAPRTTMKCDGPSPSNVGLPSNGPQSLQSLTSGVQASKKPIYDDLATIRQPQQQPPPSQTSPSPSSPTPTDRLAAQVRHARLFLHTHASIAETSFNSFMSRLLAHEHAFTSTIASLAPPPQSHEKVLPGAVYVLVATMAGSIISRSRNILLRATVPAAVGLGVAWAVLPVTMGNVSALAWKYEERVPALAENHLRVREMVSKAVKESKEGAVGLRRWTEDSVKEGRRALEQFVKKEK